MVEKEVLHSSRARFSPRLHSAASSALAASRALLFCMPTSALQAVSFMRVIDPSGGGTGRVIAATGQLTGAHNLDAVKAALKTTR